MKWSSPNLLKHERNVSETENSVRLLLTEFWSVYLTKASFECTVKLKKCVHGAAALRFDRFLSANIYMDKSKIRHAYKRRKNKKN